MWELALGLATFLGGDADSTTACSRMIPNGMRPVGSTALSLRATADSVRDDRLPPLSPESGRRYIVDTQREQVYGQVFTVTAVAGRDAQYWDAQRSVVLVWWQLGAACTHHPPQSALHPRLQELFIAARPSVPPSELAKEFAPHRMLAAELRPPEFWIGGVPTVDVQWDVGTYSPELPQVRGTPDAGLPNMTIAEYAAFYAFLPDERAVGNDLAPLRQLLAAGMTHRQWWTQYPAMGALCWAWANVREGSDDIRALATRHCR
jgi:hypothetical protein